MLDIAYSKLITGVLSTPERTAVLLTVADFLLVIGVLTIFIGAAAVVVSWKSQLTRYFLLASLVIILFEFLTPLFFSQLIAEAQRLNVESIIRIIPCGLTSILIFIGMFTYIRQN